MHSKSLHNNQNNSKSVEILPDRLMVFATDLNFQISGCNQTDMKWLFVTEITTKVTENFLVEDSILPLRI